ncbi:cysteine peptidase family C39 domain-containing protein [Prochlorococcus marinus]|uniref:cysteine peptidase family C39 domain-containing protein n=1 Tax=Prochlorococcus marinus TaxID=1219 RepID=UPI0007B3393D|nr:cysteine peptidase family C39 domain-containing protein [Prochlorococcus marinus]KZR74884.1 Lactococcin-G-processing and transport ATP-binding protein LagD [Prochlorococcus marinus str. MIT 1320]
MSNIKSIVTFRMKKRVYHECPSVTQIMESECGPAALSMLLGYYKKFVPLGVLTDKCSVTRDGSSASKIISVAEEFNVKLQGKGYRLERLKDPSLMPCIVLWNYSHWIVLEGYNENGFFINDPASGRRFEPNETFSISYSHIALLGKPGPGFYRSGNRFQEDINMFETWKPVIRHLIFITFFASMVAIPNLVIAFITGIFVQNVLQDGWLNWFRPSVSLLLLMALLMTAIKFYQFYLQRRIRLKLLKVSIEKFFNSLLEKPIDFFDQRQPGEVASRLGQLTNTVLLTTGQFVEGMSSIISVFIYLIAISLINPTIFIAILLSIIFYFIYILLAAPILIEKSKRVAVTGGYAFSSTLSAIDSIDTVKSMSLQVGVLDQFLENFNKQSSIKQEVTILSQSVDALADVLSNIMKLILIGLGSHLVIKGEMQLSGLVTISMLLQQVIDPALTKSVSYIRNLGTSYGDVARLADVYLDRSKVKPDTSQLAEYNANQIIFEQVERRQIDKIDNASFSIIIEKGSQFYYIDPIKFNLGFNQQLKFDPGGVYLFKGPHGSGKTTFSNILLGNLKFNTGNVVFQVKDKSGQTNNLSLSSPGIMSSYVNESSSFFPGPISDSITYFGQLHNLETFTDVASELGITELIDSIPGKLSYQLNATSSNISSRLLKMIEITRTVALNPNLVIFDYAFDSLDSKFCQRVIDCLSRRGSIVVIIAHSLSFIDSYQTITMSPLEASEL